MPMHMLFFHTLEHVIHLSVKFRTNIFHTKCYVVYVADGTLCDVDLKMSNVQHYKIESDYQETAVDLNKHFTGKIMILSGSLSCFLQIILPFHHWFQQNF